ncbi:MAG: M48 family metalloprotease [Pseudomonadota bacterium]
MSLLLPAAFLAAALALGGGGHGLERLSVELDGRLAVLDGPAPCWPDQFGAWAFDGFVYVCHPEVEDLDDGELAFVVGHELGHVQRRDVPVVNELLGQSLAAEVEADQVGVCFAQARGFDGVEVGLGALRKVLRRAQARLDAMGLCTPLLLDIDRRIEAIRPCARD